MTKKEVKELSYAITGYAIKVHKSLGPGLLESVYEKCLKHELISSGYHVVSQISRPIENEGLVIENELRLYLLVNKTVVVELKTVENILPVHEVQLLRYMKSIDIPQGLLINFQTHHLTKGIKPFVNEYYGRLA